MFSSIGVLVGVLLLISSHIAAGDLVVQSERLRKFKGCTAPQQKQIVEAWNEATKVAHTVKSTIDFSHYAESEFLGGEDRSKYAQDDIRGWFTFFLKEVGI